MPQCLLSAVLLLAIVGTVKGDYAADQKIPVRTMFDDQVQIRDFLEIMLDALDSLGPPVVDRRLPALVAVKCNNVTHHLAAAVLHELVSLLGFPGTSLTNAEEKLTTLCFVRTVMPLTWRWSSLNS